MESCWPTPLVGALEDEGWGLFIEVPYLVKELLIENASTVKEEEEGPSSDPVSEDQRDSFSLVRMYSDSGRMTFKLKVIIDEKREIRYYDLVNIAMVAR